MEVSSNIKNILEKKDQVILPGFGAFLKKRVDGFFDKEESTFFPPKEYIVFDQSLVIDAENILADEISTAENVSFAEASEILSNYVEDLKEQLVKNSSVLISNFGLIKKEDKTLVFEAKSNLDVNQSFFGLPPLAVKKPIVAKIEVPINEKNPEEFSLAAQALHTAISEEELEETPTSRKWLYALLFFIIAILAVGVWYFLQPQLFENLQQNLVKEKNPVKNITVIKDSLKEEKAIADSIYNDDIAANLRKEGLEVEKAKDTLNLTIHKNVVPKEPSVRYEVIIAAWKTILTAENYIKLLKSKGYADVHLIEDNSSSYKYLISVASFENQNDAIKETEKVRKKLNPKAYTKTVTN